MALRPKNVDAPAVPKPDYKGPWGEISPVPAKYIHFKRTVQGIEESWCYPYETIKRYVFKKSCPQELEILAGGDVITVRGYGLDKCLEPLEEHLLVRLEQHAHHFAGADQNERCVTEIKIV
jgi:hypothetical protein